MKKKKLLSLLLAAVLLIGFAAVFGVDGLMSVLGIGDEVIGIIGSADDQTEIFLTDGDDRKTAREDEKINTDAGEDADIPAEEAAIDEDGTYTTCGDVALYIHTYGHLPKNFVTKKQAQKAGWEGGSLEKYLPGKCIGGDHFGNYEGLLPSAKGREWTECDINTLGASSRGAERIIFSNDGLIYYTDDHYDSFQLLYGEA